MTRRGNPKGVLHTAFLGLDMRDKAQDNSILEMRNLSSDAFPCVVGRCPRVTVDLGDISGITALSQGKYAPGEISAFTGVAGRRFYYEGNLISDPSGGESLLLEGEKTLVHFNFAILIFPDKLKYSYQKNKDGKLPVRLEHLEKSVEASGLKFYSYADYLGENYTATISGYNFKDFNVGDSITIRGCHFAKNNTVVVDSSFQAYADDDIVSCVIHEIDGSTMRLKLYDKLGGLLMWADANGRRASMTANNPLIESGTVRISTSVPNMTHVCVHNNRLWGVVSTAADDGQHYGEYIWASSIGDASNWNSFQGLSTDSWYAKVSSPGAFTGIASVGSHVVAFKRNFIHHVYGDRPSNFSMPKQIFSGCVDGRSIVQINGALFFLGDDGFNYYNGGTPSCISQNITKRYVSAVGGTDKVKYYACARDEAGKVDLLCYDPRYNVWHMEDNTEFVGFLTNDNVFYGATSDTLYRWDKSGVYDFEWSWVSRRFTYDKMQYKSLIEVRLRLESFEGAYVNLESSCDDGEWIKWDMPSVEGFKTYRVPVRFRECDSFRFRLSGRGKVVVHDIECVAATGGTRI